ncbi:triose-phosphate isomerase [Methylocystis parvus]|uniref:Triosephosphate isomerase n=1 Tax=Methylocystis parvus TaxID=134 RepID=A0A6B8M8P7_9HYPH|nr:triose-phosphate isomerase [Methylocystis parvus]QGM98976.1 triose-phosphate isomerase [Methylocystis parvus]WBK00664.1 triose-phosphate isomerase [Methylocystis parvus OBBP]
MTRRPLVAGNWKMNGLMASLAEIAAMGTAYDVYLKTRVELILCPPTTLIGLALDVATQGGVGLGAQDCHADASGAHTGDISAEMLKDVGASYVIVGHSERRADHGETDAAVEAKAAAALRAGLTPIICVGETRTEREAGEALAIVGRQIEGSLPADAPGTIVVAYEPVWAIGTGLTPTLADIADMHAFARERIEARLGGGKGRTVRILYGGSVKPANARELMSVANVDGALVGGASLTAKDFMAIAAAYR